MGGSKLKQCSPGGLCRVTTLVLLSRRAVIEMSSIFSPFGIIFNELKTYFMKHGIIHNQCMYEHIAKYVS